MSASPSKTEFLPLQGALKQIQFWLESVQPPQIMLATPTMEEFKSQKLPAHCTVAKRKIHGPRVPVRGRRRVSKYPYVLAHWPKDALVEGVGSTLLFVMSGEADIRLADYVVHCRGGDLFFIPARLPKLDGSRPHYENITPEAHCEILMIHHNPESISASLCKSQGNRHMPRSEGDACWTKNFILSQLHVSLGDVLQNTSAPKSTLYLCLSLLLLFQEELASGRCLNPLQYPSESTISKQQEPIQHAMQYIQNHLDKPLTIDLVANWVGLSRTPFTKLFRGELNESFKDYLTRLRLEQAKVLLSETNLSIESISGRVGLTSGQLRHLFREKYQCTPTKFRKPQK